MSILDRQPAADEFGYVTRGIAFRAAQFRRLVPMPAVSTAPRVAAKAPAEPPAEPPAKATPCAAARPNGKHYVMAVAEYLGVSVDVVTGKSKVRRIVRARTTGMFLLREDSGDPYPSIAAQFGRKDRWVLQRAFRSMRWRLGSFMHRDAELARVEAIRAIVDRLAGRP